MKRKILSLLIAVCMVGTMLPTMTFAVRDKTGIGTNANTATAMEIKYGGQSWFVIGYDGNGIASDGGTMTLLAKYNINIDKFDGISPYEYKYANSDLKIAVENIADDFSAGEKAAIKLRTLEVGAYSNSAPFCDGVATTQVENALLWPLSTAEAKNLDSNLRKISYIWWLRSPGSSVVYAACVDTNGYVTGGDRVDYSRGIRPGFNLNMNAVLFTSAAVDGKSGTPGDGLLAVTDVSEEQKLTIIDAYDASENITGLALDTATTTSELTADSTITVNYIGATTGKTLSAIIVNNSTGAVTHYGKLVGSTTESGTANVTLPADFDSSSMSLKLFTETINGNNLTDYASTPVAVTVIAAPAFVSVTGITGIQATATEGTDIGLTGSVAPDAATNKAIAWSIKDAGSTGATIESGNILKTSAIGTVTVTATITNGKTPTEDYNQDFSITVNSKPIVIEPVTMPWGTSFMVNNKKADDSTVADRTTLISLGEKQWYVIGAKGTGVASDSTTTTLFAKDNIGGTTFDVTVPKNNIYAESTLKTEVETIADSFSVGEKGAIKQRTLDVDTYSSTEPYCDGVATIPVENALLWPLSTAEANQVNNSLCQATGTWWLRSPGNDDGNEAVVLNDGSVYFSGYSVLGYDDVRPAFNLNLNTVLFSSAAVDSKSGTAGTVLSEIIPSKEQKLTIIDAYDAAKNITGLALDTATTISDLTAGSTISVNYTGATPGKNLSAIIVKNSTGAVTYYGKLMESTDASGSVQVTLPAGFDNSAMKLKVFTETLNGDNKTDYASESVTVAPTNMAVTGITNVPTTGSVGTEIDLTGAKVVPTEATNKSIVWTVNSAGTTGVATSDLATGKFTPTAPGVLKLTATITNVVTLLTDYTQTFNIIVSEVPSITHALTVNLNSGNGGTANGNYAEGALITIDAGTRSGYSFNGWTSSNGGSFANARNTSTIFTMSANATTLTANWTYNSGGSSSGGSSRDDSPSRGSSSEAISTKLTDTMEKQTNQPITAVASVTAIVGKNGAASASIPDKAINDAISKGQIELKKQGKSTKDGITVELSVIMPKGATTFTATLSQNAFDSLVREGVTNLEISGSPVVVKFDKKALTEIQKQSSGNVNIAIAPQVNLSETAKKMIGTRPVYNIEVGYGDNRTVSNFGSGAVTVSIPYTPAKEETISGLHAVYVDQNGNATPVADSAYDADSGCIIFTTPHFSLYGVGYTPPSGKFSDISSHWAKESIDYVVSRGLLSGTSETIFEPNTAMTRGMFVTVLARLEGVDPSRYSKSSFTDVKEGSTYQPYIEWAYEKGIIRGNGHNKFGPDRAITREETAIIIANFTKAIKVTLPTTREKITYVDDSSINSTYKTAVTAMQQAGIMTGGTRNKFNPKSNVTRAEIASIIYRYTKLNIE